MNKKQLIEDLRQDAEWWLLPPDVALAVDNIQVLSEIRADWGWKVKECWEASDETESFFNLFIAEALEKE